MPEARNLLEIEAKSKNQVETCKKSRLMCSRSSERITFIPGDLLEPRKHCGPSGQCECHR